MQLKRGRFKREASSFLVGAPGGRTFQRVKVPSPPSSGKDIANGKGVVGDYESEGNRMANLWSDAQKSYQADIIVLVRGHTSTSKEVIQMNISSLSHSKWNCKYHIVFAPKYRKKVAYEELKQDIANVLSMLCKRKGVQIVGSTVR